MKRALFRFAALLGGLFLVVSCVTGCGKEQKEARLEVTDHEFIIRQDSPTSYVIDARGTIANTGEVDVKNVEVTGYCRSCGEQIINATWGVSDYEKMAHQKDVIGYLPAGAREDFEFQEIAFFPAQTGTEKPEGLPDGLEIVIESYEIAD